MALDFKRALLAMAEGKAIPNHPALRDNGVPVSVYSPGANRQDARLSQREASRHLQAYGGDQAIDWVYDAIGLYQDATSTAPWHLTNQDGTRLVKARSKGTPPDHEVGPRELYALLEEPNPFMLYSELIELLIIDLLLVGNAYWLKWRNTSDGKPLALYRLAPSHVDIIPGPFGPKRYEYKPPGAKDALKINPEEVIHFKRPNPHSAYYGLGVIQGAGRSMDLEIALTDTLAHYYENKADPSMIISSERRVPRDVFKMLRANLASRTAGPNHAGDLLVLQAGLKATTLSRSASDSLFDKLQKMSQDRVYAKFRTSRKLFGLLDEQGGDKISDARREFDNATLRPFMDKLQQAITVSLCQPWDVKFVIDYRYQMATEDIVKTGADYAAVPGIKVREVRRFFAPLGVEESTGDPDIDEMVLGLPGGELGPDGQPIDPAAGGFPDRGLPSEPGAPVKRTQKTKAFPKGGAPLPAGAKARRPKPQGKALDDFAARRAALEAKALESPKAITIGNVLPEEKRPQDRMASARSGELDATVQFIRDGVAEAAQELERELMDHAEGKALKTGKTSNVLQRVKNSAAWKTFRARVQRVLEEASRRAISTSVMHSGLEPDEDLDYDAIAASIVNRPDGVRGIVANLKERVANEVRDARASDRDITQAIQGEIGQWTGNWLETVAESEAVEAYNEGTLAAAEAAGVTSVFVVEEEDAPDKPCQEARWQVWDIPTARERRKEHPRCRRAFIPLAEGAVA